MTKFKVGDEVRCIKATFLHPVGTTCVVSDVHEYGGLYFDGDHQCWDRTYWEPASNVTPAPIAGRKDDGGKLDMTLYDDMPRALEAVAEVMQWAITKKQPKPYERGSWLGVSADRYRAAIKRHDSAACKQTLLSSAPARQQHDDETNLLHLAHMACSALFALELTLREMEAK